MDYLILQLSDATTSSSSFATDQQRRQAFETYLQVPMTFVSQQIFTPVVDNLSIHLELTDVKPFTKNYDEVEHPRRWLDQWQMENWMLIQLMQDDLPVAGAIVVFDDDGVNMLRGPGTTVLWDIRVAPDYRGKGLGRKIFEMAADWSRQQHCNIMIIETQNNNVAACSFYQKMGCELLTINRIAYSALPEETQLIFSYSLI